MTKYIDGLNRIVWGAPALVLIVGVGLYLSLRLRFAQLTLFPRAWRRFLSMLRPGQKSGNGVTPFQALCTALAATVGTGNIVGVAGAICLGGPGAIFWMWICGVLGMVTKYAEVTLALRYRVKTPAGWIGGPMYVITQGLGTKFTPMAVAYCVFGVVAAFGVGNATQINAVISGVNDVVTRFGGEQTRLGNLVMGLILAALVGAMLLGGARRIGIVAERLVPFISIAYILLCAVMLVLRWREVPAAFASIAAGAFSPRAVTGGALGSAYQALRIGCSRGVFTNRQAWVPRPSPTLRRRFPPAEQGLMGIMEVFLDTILMCTLTALVILVSGVPVPYGRDVGVELTTKAFAAVYGDFAPVFIAVSLVCFAFATVLGWGLYGARCAQFLFGARAWKFFVAAQMAAVVAGACLQTGVVWSAAEAVNGLMVIPNLTALAILTPEVVRLTKEYQKSGGSTAGGGNYADIHQRKPV
ncbi:MAG: amino acid carrier protein [Oscillospiraceae bacterium]